MMRICDSANNKQLVRQSETNTEAETVKVISRRVTVSKRKKESGRANG